MAHGFAFAQYDHQGGARGDDQLGSLNWGMLMASRPLAGGRIEARTMLSLDALGVTGRGYPLLLQSGETYLGASIHDRQHPHDLWMELAALYEHPITPGAALSLYAAPAGEPALGPVAFMHRPSAMDNPFAPIGHHWQDATHVAFGVVTAGLFTDQWKFEASAFNSREPDDQRWNFDLKRLDSYSGRISFRPNTNLGFTAGFGRLKSPEAAHPDEPVNRITASALFGRTLGTDGRWATTLIWGANHAHADWSHSILIESEASLDDWNTVFGRAERAEKTGDELVLEGIGIAPESRFSVMALSVGYVREVVQSRSATFGIGAMMTANVVPSALEAAYGSRTPLGAVIFVRLRVRGSHASGMEHMSM